VPLDTELSCTRFAIQMATLTTLLHTLVKEKL